MTAYHPTHDCTGNTFSIILYLERCSVLAVLLPISVSLQSGRKLVSLWFHDIGSLRPTKQAT
ncbi:hypothetical protein C7212DRAFT_307260 [Tuber magnatum]|uniref:Uncharacterized protein n=1 Tax=Tuber magnatum TaxID=42249 RepID=A0A317T5X6_9PEZI|nr:hypothetical protein C7212DRAFT_307260 [Tuber magnatum]